MKKILLVLFVIFLTGCTATVNINIDNNKIIEKTTVIASDSNEYNQIKNWNGFPLLKYNNENLENPFSNEKQEGFEYYDVTNDDANNTVTVNAEFTYGNHSDSSLINGCFRNYNILKDGSKLVFLTTHGLICKFYNFNIVVTTPYKVILHNADVVDKVNNIYTWKITKDKIADANVYLEIDTSKKYKEENTINVNNNGTPPSSTNTNSQVSSKTNSYIPMIVVITLIVMILILLVIYLLRQKSKSASKI